MPENTTTRRALIVVDVQPTFCEGGDLPVDGGNAVAERIGDLLRTSRGRYDLVVTTQDWHVDPGDHFSPTPDFVDSWPVHGVAGSPNADLHPAVRAALAEAGPADVTIRKGAYTAAYSGFEGTDAEGRTLAEVLAAAAVDRVEVCGIAESHCVKETALDAVRAGLATTLLGDLTVPVTPELGEAARTEMAQAGVVLTTSTTPTP